MDSQCSNFWRLLVFVSLIALSSGSLSADFYKSSWPKLLSTVRREVVKAVAKEYRMGASLLRLHFHDCFVNGCDASVLLDDTSNFTGEKTAVPNKDSLRGFEVIDTIKTLVEAACPSVVSCADILSIAARDSVVALGGPAWVVGLGRRDSTTASFDSANNDLPSPFLDLADIDSAFSAKGFTTKELVALSVSFTNGSHTIGQARCSMFRVRAHNETNIEPEFAASLRSSCPMSGDDNKLSPLDVSTPSNFDNAYFANLRDSKGLLHSDQVLFNNGSADSHVTTYSTDSSAFFADFASAMVKMSNLSPLTGSSGEIRSDYRKTN